LELESLLPAVAAAATALAPLEAWPSRMARWAEDSITIPGGGGGGGAGVEGAVIMEEALAARGGKPAALGPLSAAATFESFSPVFGLKPGDADARFQDCP
jgi:hypothetical protein